MTDSDEIRANKADEEFHFDKANAGLCANCQHAQRIESDRGSVFLLCELSFKDSRFPKYPRLPVLACDGYERKPSPN